MSKYSQFSDDSTTYSFTDSSPMLNIGSQLKFSNEYNTHIPNYMQNVFTNKFNKVVENIKSSVEDNNSQILKHKSCILLKDNNVQKTKTVQFSELTINITKQEQKNIYPSSNELYIYEKSDNYSEDYLSEFIVQVSNIDLEKNSDIIENKNSDIVIEKLISKKYNIICNCFSFIFE
jgi:hypothetical protein